MLNTASIHPSWLCGLWPCLGEVLHSQLYIRFFWQHCRRYYYDCSCKCRDSSTMVEAESGKKWSYELMRFFRRQWFISAQNSVFSSHIPFNSIKTMYRDANISKCSPWCPFWRGWLKFFRIGVSSWPSTESFSGSISQRGYKCINCHT